MTHNISRSPAVVTFLIPKRTNRIENPGDKSVFRRVTVSSYNSEKWEKSYYSEGDKNRILQRLPSLSAHLGFYEPPARYYPIYLNGLRSNRAVIDLNRTPCFLKSACNCIRALVNNKGHLLLVNTDPLCNDIIKQMGKRTNQSYINSKWIGGFLTNWGHMIHDKHLRFPNKAYSNNSPRFLRMQRSYEGLKTREILDGLVTLNAHRNFYAICEAHRSRMLIVSLVDSILPENLYRLVTHPIPVNNDSIWVTNLFSLLVTKTVIHSVRAQIINKRKGPKGGYNPYYADSRGTKNSINNVNVRSYCTSSSDSDTEDTNFPWPPRYEFGSSSNDIRERAFSLYEEFKEDRKSVNSVKEELNFSSMELSERDLRTLKNNPVFIKLQNDRVPKIENIVTEFALENNGEQGSRDPQIAHKSANLLNSCQSAHRALSSLLVNEPVESREHLLDQVKSVDQTLDSVASGYKQLFDVSGGDSSDSSGNEGDRDNGESDSDPNDGNAFDFLDFFLSVRGWEALFFLFLFYSKQEATFIRWNTISRINRYVVAYFYHVFLMGAVFALFVGFHYRIGKMPGL